MREFYVYIHKKADDLTPFYVGKGKNDRATERYKRSPQWKSVVASHGFVVELAYIGLTEDEAYALEAIEIGRLRERGYELANVCPGGRAALRPDLTEWKKQAIRDFFAEHGRPPSDKRKQERKLAYWLRSYCSPSSCALDRSFSEEMRALGYGNDRIARNAAKNKEEVIEFYRSHGRFPSQHVKQEQALYGRLARYCHKKGRGYDAELDAWARALGYGIERVTQEVSEKKQKLRSFIREYGRFPQRGKDEERVLYYWLRSYCDVASNAYDPVFDKDMRELGFGSNRGKRPRKGVIRQ